MRIIGAILIFLNIVLVGAGAYNRIKRLNEKHVALLALLAILDILTGFMAGIYLVGGA